MSSPEPARQEKAEIRQEEAEVRQEKAEVRQEEAEVRQKEAEVRQKEAEVRQKEAEVRQKEAEVRQKEAEVRQKEAEVRQKEAEVRQKEAEVRQEGIEGVAPPSLSPLGPHITWQKLTLLPALLVAALLATWLWFRQAHLDPVSENALSHGQVSKALWQHIELTAISTFFVLIIAIPLGILLTRPAFRKAAPVARAVARTGRAAPAIGLLALLVIWLGTGMRTAVIGIIAYAVLPVLSNTVAGLKANDPTLLEAARGLGMSPWEALGRVELPLALPLILAGVRTALVLDVGTATLAAFGGGGGLGVLITTGITAQRTPVLVLGSVLTVSLALLVDWLASLAELLLRPRGLDAGT